jgi:hypothetical protein
MIIVIQLIKQELPHVQALQRDYCLSINSLFAMTKSLQELFYALRLIGIVLIVRQVSYIFPR